MKTAAVVSRKWDNPTIEAFATVIGVGASMDMQDVLKALVKEIGNPTMMFTQAQLLARLQAAWLVVEAEIKEGTRHV